MEYSAIYRSNLTRAIGPSIRHRALPLPCPDENTSRDQMRPRGPRHCANKRYEVIPIKGHYGIVNNGARRTRRCCRSRLCAGCDGLRVARANHADDWVTRGVIYIIYGSRYG